LAKRRSLLEQQTRKNRPAPPTTAAGSSSSPAPGSNGTGKDKGKGKKDAKKRARDSGIDSVGDLVSIDTVTWPS
jgi:hypothetical protein